MTPEQARDALVFALDVDHPDEAREWAARLAGAVRWIKVGARLYCAAGPPVVAMLREAGFRVFVDLKFHDIPDQVEGACREAARLGAGMLTVHTSGGAAMMAAAAEGSAAGAAAIGEPPPVVLGVTVLTSLDAAALRSLGVQRSPAEQVDHLAALAAGAGIGGVVCSAREVGRLRARHPRPFCFLTPGIRPAGAATDDQARVATPAAAVRDGADYLVVGRPIKRAPDPVAAAERILAEMSADG